MSWVIWAVREVAMGMVFLLPFLCIMNWKSIHDRKKTCLYLIFTAYLMAVYFLVGLPTVLYMNFRMSFGLNMIPFVGMIDDLPNELSNIMLFVPLGFFLPVLWEKYQSWWRTLFFGTCTSVLIEVLQCITSRTVDINDVITNSLGTLLGFVIAKCVRGDFSTCPSAGKTRDLAILCAAVMVTMFFLQPVVSSLIWEGKIVPLVFF